MRCWHCVSGLMGTSTVELFFNYFQLVSLLVELQIFSVSLFTNILIYLYSNSILLCLFSYLDVFRINKRFALVYFTNFFYYYFKK